MVFHAFEFEFHTLCDPCDVTVEAFLRQATAEGQAMLLDIAPNRIPKQQ
jgi:hypothetical protein